MKCEEALIAISAALDGEAGQEELHGLKAHLELCSECRAVADDFGLMSAALAEQAELPAGFAERMEQTLNAEKKKPNIWKRYGSLAAMLAVVLCLSGLFAVGGGSFSAKKDAAMEANMSNATSAAGAGIFTGDYSLIADADYGMRDIGEQSGPQAVASAAIKGNSTHAEAENSSAPAIAPMEPQKDAVQYNPPDHATIYSGLETVFEHMGGFAAYPGLCDKDYYFFALERTENAAAGEKTELRLEYAGLSPNGKYLVYMLREEGQNKDVAYVTNLNSYAVSIETWEVLQEYAEDRSDADHTKAYRQATTE